MKRLGAPNLWLLAIFTFAGLFAILTEGEYQIRSSLIPAISSRDNFSLKLLISLGADVNKRDASFGDTPLLIAVGDDNLDAVKILVANGALAKLRGKDGSAYEEAVKLKEKGYPQMLEALQNARDIGSH